jgi:hypothetical protein
VFFVNALLVAQPPSCYYPESPRVCQVVNSSNPIAQNEPTIPDPSVAIANQSGVSFKSFAPLLGLPLLGVPLFQTSGNGPGLDDGTTNGKPPSVPAPVPMALPGIIVGASLLWAARRNRATLAALPLLLVPITTSPAIAPTPAAQEMVFPLISGNMMTVNYAGQNISIATPLTMPQDTSKYRYYVQAIDNGWQVCWEEIKPQICPPKATPRRILG